MAPQVRAVAQKVGRSLRHPIQELGAAAIIGAAVGFVAGAAVVLTLHFTHVLSGPDKRVVAPFSPVPDNQAESLARRFRPWLLFDSGGAGSR